MSLHKEAVRTMIITYLGLVLGYLNKGVLFILILSTEQIGLINLILGVGLLFAQFSNLGVINTIAKFLPFFNDDLNQKQSFLQLNLKIVGLGILIFTIIAILFQNIIVDYYSLKSALFVDFYYWIIPVGISNVLFIVLETYLKSLHKNLLSVFVFEFLLRFFITILLFLLWFKKITFNQFFVFHSLIYFIPVIILFIYLYKIRELQFKKYSISINKKMKKIIFSYSLFSYSNTLGILLVMTIDALMIAYFLGLKQTGVYTTVIYLTSALQIPFKSLMRVSLPLIPKYWKEKNINNMENLYKKTSSIFLLISLFLFLITWLNIDFLFSYFPKEYKIGIFVFMFLMIGRIIDMYFGLNAWILMTSKKYKYDMIFTLILLLLVFGINCFLIPIYGIIGAAISTGIAMVVYNICRMLFLFYCYKIHPFEKNQLYVIGLFFSILIIFSNIPDFSRNGLVVLIFKSIFISILYLGIIILFKLNKDLNAYIYNVLSSKFRLKLNFLNQ